MLNEQLLATEEEGIPRAIWSVDIATQDLEKGIGNETTLEGRKALLRHNLLVKDSLETIISILASMQHNPDPTEEDYRNLKKYLTIGSVIQANNLTIIEGMEEEVKLSIIEEDEYLQLCNLIQETYNEMQRFVNMMGLERAITMYESTHSSM